MAVAVPGDLCWRGDFNIETQSGDAQALDRAAYDSVSAVINHGANLFNTYNDYKGEANSSVPPQKTAEVSGKVMYKGRPCPEGWYVTLVSSTDKHTYSTYIRDGQYTFRIPIPAGNYTIAIEEGPREKRRAVPAGAAIPQRYQNPVTSGLTLEVRPGPNRHDLQLQ